jgi:serine/threonine-protein phosphatase 2A regulatory subunit A
MMHLSEQLGNLTEILDSSENLSQLIDPLEIMIGNDDSVVREKAINSMRKVGRLINDEHVIELYLPMLKR